MTLPYYMDVHVPAAITEGLRRRAIDVLTSQEDGTRTSQDDELLQRATTLRRVLMSQDEDLLQIAHDWQAAGVRSWVWHSLHSKEPVSVGSLKTCSSSPSA
jgi:predicted nuclease of predicted toxin-antitoxin system